MTPLQVTGTLHVELANPYIYPTDPVALLCDANLRTACPVFKVTDLIPTSTKNVLPLMFSTIDTMLGLFV